MSARWQRSIAGQNSCHVDDHAPPLVEGYPVGVFDLGKDEREKREGREERKGDEKEE